MPDDRNSNEQEQMSFSVSKSTDNKKTICHSDPTPYRLLQGNSNEQDELTEKLKSEFTVAQFKLILELLDVTNYRNAVEKHYMYLYGLKDCMKMLNQFNDFLLN